MIFNIRRGWSLCEASIFFPVSENEVQHQAIQQKCRSIGSDNGEVAFDDPIHDPEGKACDKYQEHSGGNVFNFFCFPGFQELGYYGSGSADSCYEAKDVGPIQFVGVCELRVMGCGVRDAVYGCGFVEVSPRLFRRR